MISIITSDDGTTTLNTHNVGSYFFSLIELELESFSVHCLLKLSLHLLLLAYSLRLEDSAQVK